MDDRNRDRRLPDVGGSGGRPMFADPKTILLGGVILAVVLAVSLIISS
ncbi:hypothetical protein Q7C18_11335 [Nesterenkonia sp. CL21]|nr:hypothetical protein [Nesterenkonia sp. CL21]MDS2173294.1 hypothetical protein [Nesterenkonia sp. CL21]